MNNNWAWRIKSKQTRKVYIENLKKLTQIQPLEPATDELGALGKDFTQELGLCSGLTKIVEPSATAEVAKTAKRHASTTTAPEPTEFDHQRIIIAWADKANIPLVHIPNEGKRTPWGGHRLKQAGMRRGFPDLFLPIARGGYHGLFIELKRNKASRISEHQLEWIARLNREGYLACVMTSADDAINTIKDYMNRERS